MYVTSYREGDFPNRGHLLLEGVATSVMGVACSLVGVACRLVGVAFEKGSSWAVTFIGSGCGLPLESVSSTST